MLKSKVKTLKTLCINIEDTGRDKLNLLIDTVKTDKTENMPDIVCLTEVTESAFKYLSSVLENYIFFQVFISEENESGSVILCNKNTVSISDKEPPYYFDYPKGKGRIMGTGIVHHATGLTFNILTADMDQQREDIRDIQFSTLSKVLKNIDKDSYIIMGDLGASGEGTLTDAWTKVGCPARLASTTVDITSRLTRILYSVGQRTGALTVKALSLVGTKHPIGSHYGVEAIFNISKRGF